MKVQKKDNITAEKNKKCLVILLFELPCMFSKDIGYNFLQNEIISADFREKDENKKNTYMARKKLLQYFLWTKKAVMKIKGG